MATKVCPFCKEKVKKNAILCKHCKSELPPLPPQPPKKWYQTWWGFFVIVYGFCFLTMPFQHQNSSTTEKVQQPVREWILLHNGNGGDSDIYYDQNSIKKINDYISEIQIDIAYSEFKHTIHDVRIDCKNNKTAIGLSTDYNNGVKEFSFDNSKKGWVWNAPFTAADKKFNNSLDIEFQGLVRSDPNSVGNKLIKLVCNK